MSIFGKFGEKRNKNSLPKGSRDISILLTEVSGEIIKKGAYTRFGVGFIKLTADYSTRVARSQLDNDRYLVDTLEGLVKIRQEDESDKNVISLYETLPDLIKFIKMQLSEQEKDLEKLERSGEKMMKQLDGVLEEIENLKAGK